MADITLDIADNTVALDITQSTISFELGLPAPTNIVRKTDADVSANSWVLDEDDFASDSATKVPTQQSAKAYADTKASASHNHAASDITSGTLAHERGGLEADVSGYSGLVKISGGTTSQAVADTDYQSVLAEGAFADGDKTKLDGLPDSARKKLTANLNLYVNGSTGSDSNDGLTSGTAFATLQKAADVAFGDYDLGGYNITINVAAGTYAAGVEVNYPQTGSGIIHFKGDETTPSNVLVSTGAAVCFHATGNARFRISGIKMQNTGYALVLAESGAIIDLKVRNELGGTSGHRVVTQFNGVVYSDGEEIISGTAAGAHYRASDGGIIYCQSATWTASGTATQLFAWGTNLGIVYAYANSSSGTFSGQRYNASNNGMVNSNGGGASYFPGSSAGATGTGGIYG